MTTGVERWILVPFRRRYARLPPRLFGDVVVGRAEVRAEKEEAWLGNAEEDAGAREERPTHEERQ